MSVLCIACGSVRLVEQTKLSTLYPQLHGEILLHMPARGPLGLIETKTSVRASTCVDCGHVHFHALNRDELLTAYEHQQRVAVVSDN
jgi:hypothetical protein